MIRVLIVDDNEAVRRGLSAMFSAVGIEIAGLCADGAEAVRAVSRTHPDLVLMDLVMPVMNGVDAIRMIHASVPQTRVLVLTGAMTVLLQQAIDAGAVGYVFKDASSADLVEAVRLHALREQ